MNILTKNLKPLAFAVIAGASLLGTVTQAASLSAQQTIYPGQGGMIVPQLTFNQVESGDLYLAVRIEGQLYFILSDGSLSISAIPFLSNQDFSGTLDLPQFDTTGIPVGQYPLYQVITYPGTDVFNFSNWVGGIGALNVINFTIGLPVSVTKDFNNDGWSDDDLNHDGYHDDDHNKDGYHDDDHDKDGYHDDDENESNESEDNSNNESDEHHKYEDDEHEDDEHEDDEHEDDEHEDDEHEDDEHEDDEHEEDEHEDDNEQDNSNTTNSTVSTTNTSTNTSSTSSTTNSSSGTNSTSSSSATAVDQSVARGKTSYASYCSSCHGSNPLNNGSGILSAKSAAASRSAISRNKGGMGFLTNSDADLQDIANYINSL